MPLPNFAASDSVPGYGSSGFATPGRRASGGGGGGGSGARPRAPPSVAPYSGRYFDTMDDEAPIRPGELSASLRALLGMQSPYDPPPYLIRMQQLGYPPGYLGDPNAHKRGGGGEAEAEAPLRLYEQQPPPPPLPPAERDALPSLPTVDFPGLNVPPPPGADLAAWNWPPR